MHCVVEMNSRISKGYGCKSILKFFSIICLWLFIAVDGWEVDKNSVFSIHLPKPVQFYYKVKNTFGGWILIFLRIKEKKKHIFLTITIQGKIST